MTLISILIGAVVLAASFGLMVAGRRYLGEEKGRNPGKPGETGGGGQIDNPCAKCGSCPGTGEKGTEERQAAVPPPRK